MHTQFYHSLHFLILCVGEKKMSMGLKEKKNVELFLLYFIVFLSIYPSPILSKWNKLPSWQQQMVSHTHARIEVKNDKITNKFDDKI